jgi:predicted GNAT family acetyltransferase
MSDDVRVTHDAQRGRFAATVEGHDCELDYRLDGRVLTILHTGVPQAVGGRGIAAALTLAAAQYARAEGLTIYPACSYAATWFRRHSEYSDLITRL